MTLKDKITKAMFELGKRDDTYFIGYNLAYGSKCYGTMNDVPRDKILEMPIAEYLMTGIACGMSMVELQPVLVFERHDFTLMAMDQLKNHIDMIPRMSGGQFKLPLLIRSIVGSKTPLHPGPQHCQDYTNVFRGMFDTIKIIEVTPSYSHEIYLRDYDHPVMFIEKREDYNK